ncbi:MAG: ClpP family protease [Planctomycetota bacterium]
MRAHRLDCPAEGETGKKDEKGFAKELLDSRSIILSDAISEELARGIYAQLVVLNDRDPKAPITFYINSPGGDADSGFGIHDMMRFIEAPIHSLVCGLCASAAVPVFLGADKGKNYALPNARFLLHQPSTGVRGDASDIQITADEIEKTRDRYNRIVSEFTRKKPEQIAKDADRDFWLSAEEAKAYGLVSAIVTKRAEIQ